MPCHKNNAAPTTSEMDDNAAFNITVVDKTKLIGYIDFPAMVDQGDIGYAQNLDVRLGYKCVGTANLYGILQILDAETNESAAMTVTIELHAMQD